MPSMFSFCLLTLVVHFTYAQKSDELVSVIVLFRHGARAPTDRFSNQTFQKYFPNGLGELTDSGIKQSHLVGKFLRDRYTNGFLRKPLLPTEVYFRSKANNRCLMTASLVANAMFSAEGGIGPMAPIYSQEKGDRLLSGSLDCDLERERAYATCGRYPKRSYEKFTEYEGFIYECLGLQKNSTLFPTGKSFEIVDSLINEHQNDLPMPSWFYQHKSEIYNNFFEVENFIIGTAKYHYPALLRTKCGFLLHTVFDQLKSNWETFASEGVLNKKKFIAYSTQDWLMHSFMDAMGIRSAAIGENSMPGYNSLLIIELRRINDQPIIQVFYRDPFTKALNNVTPSIRGCKSLAHCPLSLVLNCCTQYVTDNPEKECYPSRSTQR